MMKLQRLVVSHLSLRNPPKLLNIFFFLIQHLFFFLWVLIYDQMSKDKYFATICTHVKLLLD